MSLDYPARADWLAKRCTPRGRKRPLYGQQIWFKGTFRATPSRTKQKIFFWERREANKRARRAAKRVQQLLKQP